MYDDDADDYDDDDDGDYDNDDDEGMMMTFFETMITGKKHLRRKREEWQWKGIQSSHRIIFFH